MIVVAMPKEIDLVGVKDEPILITGFGALNVIQALKDVPRDTPIYNVGYAGSNTIKKGTRCRIGKVRMFHPVAGDDGVEYDLDGDVPCYTSGDFVEQTEIMEPCIFDMELAFILALGFKDVVSVKIVSDNLCLEEYEKCLEKQMIR